MSVMHMLQFANRAAAFSALTGYRAIYAGRSRPILIGDTIDESFVDAGGRGEPGIPIVQTPAVADGQGKNIAQAVMKSGYSVNVMADAIEVGMPGLTAAADRIDDATGAAHLVFGTAPITPQRVFYT